MLFPHSSGLLTRRRQQARVSSLRENQAELILRDALHDCRQARRHHVNSRHSRSADQVALQARSLSVKSLNVYQQAL